ncbi:DUF3078 domain-containing protein [Pontibacter sp. 172403-2]|uniref:DUF3078 domain-containing protein n=1 Tax=Pontibacter rufus TaxID=2791028 RepID=UPI0018AFE76C|nr:DUF3078 domain-containing protein [Pontibacter sp. 172403-2]MBF9253512.1 DUF3078 domain-containing protein [Pontibacter sp. 172403-2]
MAQEAAPADTTDIWDFGGEGTVNFSQISLSNWASGGQNALSVLGVANLYGNYKHGPSSWNNTLDITYGMVKLENQQVRKSDDKLELNVKYGYKASERWFYSAQLNLKTQLTPTYTETRDTLISSFMSPAFVLLSLGMDYKPNDHLSVFISPLTGKLTIVESQMLADRGAFGVKGAARDASGNLIPGTGKHLRKEFGGYVNVRYKQEILQNVTLQSKLDLFTNYLNDPQNIDVNWENALNFKVNSFISASLLVHLIYDDDVNIAVDSNEDGKIDSSGPRLQTKEVLGIGLSYKFN